jgi:YebC/PmpR family DNA-binding regulatory protein
MSGHNKWTQIKRKKGATDQKRGLVFSKLLKSISIAAREDANPNYNPQLKAAIDRAREFNVPQDNIERAIKKSSETKDLKELLMEAYGPEGVAILILSHTDNSNRTIAEIKKILHDHNAKWADPGSVMWAFDIITNQHGQEPKEYEGGWKAKFPQKISPKAEDELIKLMEALDDHADVSDIFTSAELSD